MAGVSNLLLSVLGRAFAQLLWDIRLRVNSDRVKGKCDELYIFVNKSKKLFVIVSCFKYHVH